MSYRSSSPDSDRESISGDNDVPKEHFVPNDFQLNLPLLVYLRKLGELSFERYQAADSLDDLRMCIHAMRDASYLISDENSEKPSVLVFFARALRTRFERMTFSPDLDEAILSLTQAVVLTSDDVPEKPSRLLLLISGLHARFKLTMDLTDLGDAVKWGTHVLELTPEEHLDRPTRLNSLAVSLQARFERSGGLPDLQEAVRLKTLAVDTTPESHPDMPAQLSNLAISLFLRYQRLGSIADLEQAIKLQMRAVESTPKGHSDRTVMLRSLGRSLRTRLNSAHAKADDLTQARRACLQAMQDTSGHPDWRLRAGLDYVELLSHPSSTSLSNQALLQAYEYIISLVSTMSWLGGNIRKRHEQPVDFATLASNAVTAAIAAGDFVKALEWFEHGRANVTSQALRTGSPLDDLRKHHPQLASDLQHAYQALLDASSPKDPISIDNPRPQIPLEAQAQTTRSFVLGYEALLSQVRELDGFRDSMHHQKIAQLDGACASGPIVAINVNESRCDALVLYHLGKVAHVPLPGFSYDYAKKLRQQLFSVLKSLSSGSRLRNGSTVKEERGAGPRDDPGNDLLHITWLPTGPLVSLPLHAAGVYSNKGTSESIMDFAVSSYAPTLNTLLRPQAARASQSDDQHPKILIASQPDTPGYLPIEGTETEAAFIMSIFGQSTTTLERSDGTVEAVVKAMMTHDWVHFACHGVHDSSDPTNSSFVLHDGKLTLSKLMSSTLPNAELAVISACQTFTGNVDEHQSETAVQLATGMLYAGYKSVISSMWSVHDDSAPTMASVFYQAVAQQLAEGKFKPAHALYEATKALRKEFGEQDFVRWVPFVHYGL
ncbi:CHAT domain-containing protein [Irpex rosettiformis]|uniref:CHAT domain-containing protein n=1 Tax=Irpex rosettiformis TaxID=378272 RepID=A0ACB8U492_9APHY|nr:CHAT domain-containing protein [Irpex rosettiformis]